MPEFQKSGTTSLVPFKASLSAEIDGVEYPAIAANVEYAMNSIPVCSVDLALGVNATTLAKSPVHTQGVKLLTLKPFKLKCSISSEDAATKAWSASGLHIPNGEFVLFDGYTAGPLGFRKGQEGAALTVASANWLVDLQYSSCLSSRLFADAPENMFMHYGFAPVAGGQQVTTVIQNMSRILPNFTDDMWAGLKEIFTRLSTDPTIMQFMGIQSSNDAAMAAINKFDGDIIRGLLSLDAVFQTSKADISAQLVRSIFNTVQGSSMWDKLLQCGAAFFFSVIPTVNSATLAPHTSIIKNPGAEIDASDIYCAELRPQITREMAGMLLLRYNENITNRNDEGQQWASLLAGASDPNLLTDKTNKGMLFVKSAPGWILPGGIAPSVFTQSTTPAGSGTPKSSQSKNTNASKPKTVPQLTKSIESALDQGNALARYWFAEEKFKMRVGSVDGPVRFDIGPGSAVRLNLASDKIGSLAGNMYANVLKVILTFDSRAPMANTKFILNAIRDEGENEKYGLDKHPMYKDAWNGTALIGNE